MTFDAGAAIHRVLVSLADSTWNDQHPRALDDLWDYAQDMALDIKKEYDDSPTLRPSTESCGSSDQS